MDQPIEELSHKFNFLNLSSKEKPDITIQEFEAGITHFIALCNSKSPIQLSTASFKNKLDNILFYFENPLKVKGVAIQGGLNKLRKKYDADLIRIQFAIHQKKNLHIPHPPSFVSGLGLFAETIKVQNAYRSILKGKKFIKAGLKENDYKNVNPIEQISTQNIQKLIIFLKEGGKNNNSFGLRQDEVELFKVLLNLPYKLQHATNYYYPVLNSGSLDSYTEIHRHHPDYESPFSTKGNIEKLGNGGFVFFRTYVEGVNGNETRYGDTSITFDLQLLRKCGWISLHDQLVPFSTPGAEHFYSGNRLLRRAETIGINNKSKDKTMNDGICYEYRTSPIKNYTSHPKDALKQLGNKITSQKRIISFTDEMFYGPDILPGIALSVIRELRYLEACGFRKDFLNKFSTAAAPQKQILLGELIKGLFRIEGKYPAALRLHLTDNTLSHQPVFASIAASDNFLPSENHATVKNPDGDKRYTLNLEVNPLKMDMAQLEEEKKKIKEWLSIARRQRAKFKDTNQYKKWNNEVKQAEFEEKRNALKAALAERLNELSPEISLQVYQNKRLYGLLLEGIIPFTEFASCTLQEVQLLCNYDIAKPILERGYTIRELLDLHKQSHWHLDALTCDDLTELVLDIAPKVNAIVMEYARDEEVDIGWVIDQLCESDQETFKINLGFYDEPVSDFEEHLEEIEGNNQEPNDDETGSFDDKHQTFDLDDVLDVGKARNKNDHSIDQSKGAHNSVNMDALLNFHLLKTNNDNSSQSEPISDLSPESKLIKIPGLD